MEDWSTHPVETAMASLLAFKRPNLWVVQHAGPGYWLTG